jgi:hypothetical protein
MLEWIQCVWVPWLSSKSLNQSYLIMNSSKAHMVASVSDALASLGTMPEFIVGGCTSTMQVLDVGINRPFKLYGRAEYEALLRARQPGQKPGRPDIESWISKSWRQITTETILNT